MDCRPTSAYYPNPKIYSHDILSRAGARQANSQPYRLATLLRISTSQCVHTLKLVNSSELLLCVLASDLKIDAIRCQEEMVRPGAQFDDDTRRGSERRGNRSSPPRTVNQDRTSHDEILRILNTEFTASSAGMIPCWKCKKDHLGCDPDRPCRRCIAIGQAVRRKLCP